MRPDNQTIWTGLLVYQVEEPQQNFWSAWWTKGYPQTFGYSLKNQWIVSLCHNTRFHQQVELQVKFVITGPFHENPAWEESGDPSMLGRGRIPNGQEIANLPRNLLILFIANKRIFFYWADSWISTFHLQRSSKADHPWTAWGQN